MQKKRQHTNLFIIILLFISSGFVSWSLYFRSYIPKDSIDIHSFPMDIGDWKARDIPISDNDYEILETRNVFTRAYTNAAEKTVYLFIVYSQDNRKVSHPPEICYTGSGATVVSRKPAKIHLSNGRVFEAQRILIEQGPQQQVAYYWYKVGEQFTSNYWTQQILFSLKNLLGRPTSSALIRVSIDVNQVEDEWGMKAAGTIEEFSSLLVPQILKSLP